MLSSAYARPMASKTGLPSSPASARTRRHELHESDNTQRTSPQSLRQLRAQRSTPSISVSRDSSANAPPLPNPRIRSDLRLKGTVTAFSGRSIKGTGHGSDGFPAAPLSLTPGTTLLESMKVGVYASPSDTSISDPHSEFVQAPKAVPAEGPISDTPVDDLKSMSTLGDEYSIWNRMATAAASVLTVNVNKTWTSKISTFSGEETPPGQESRLTRAMKAYHLEKARDPSDLPEWLFTEDERRLTTSSRFISTQAPENSVSDRPASSPPRSLNLRDIYDKAAATSTSSRITESSTRRIQSDVGVVPSKATNRLKALRDEKRNALGIRSTVPISEPEAERPASLNRGGGNRIAEGRADPRTDVSYHSRRPSRPGLPSRPRVH